MPEPTPPSKTMSSRLLTMKFMQRGSPSSSSPGTPSEPAYKRQRLSNGTSGTSTPQSDAQRVSDALAAEERKRNEAVEREAADRGETKWYLSVQQASQPGKSAPGLRVVEAGYSVLDAGAADADTSDEEEDGEVDEAEGTTRMVQGRMNFGKFSRKTDAQTDATSNSPGGDDDDAEEDEDNDNDPSGVAALISQSRREAAEKARAGRQAKRKADDGEGKRMADERRKKQVKLNGSRGISSGGGSTPTKKGFTGKGGRR